MFTVLKQQRLDDQLPSPLVVNRLSQIMTVLVTAQPSTSIAVLAQTNFVPHLDAVFLCTMALLRNHLVHLFRPCQPSLRSIAAAMHEIIFADTARCIQTLTALERSKCVNTDDCVDTLLSAMYICYSPVQSDLDAMWRSQVWEVDGKPDGVRYASGVLKGRQVSLRKRWMTAIQSLK